jgi:hypothetical protein
MRTSGKDSDLAVIAVPVLLLVVAGVALAGDPGKFFSTVENHLWHGVESVGRWISSLLS